MSRYTVIDNQHPSIKERPCSGIPKWLPLKIDHELVAEVIMQKRIAREKAREAETGVRYFEDADVPPENSILPLPFRPTSRALKQAA